jgi:hypothetical protein
MVLATLCVVRYYKNVFSKLEDYRILEDNDYKLKYNKQVEICNYNNKIIYLLLYLLENSFVSS